MRTIKFRGKRVDNGEWVYGYLLKHSSRTEILVSHSDQTLDYDIYRITPETVGQFTGLLDKNGKEIYEGDVTALHFVNKVDFISEVYFKSAAFKVNRNGINNNPWNLYGWSGQWEIIGNIHDNPELLTNG